MYLRLGLSCFILLTILSCTTLARSNVRQPPAPRHHRRRAATLSEFLTPPPPPTKNRQKFPQPAPFRQGKILNTVPSPQSDNSGFFARFMGWINPWSAPAAPPVPPSNHPGYQQPVKPHETYGPPQYENNGRPPSQVVHHRPPQIAPKNCHPCNHIPWSPMFPAPDEIFPGDGGYIQTPSHEVRIPDFGWNQDVTGPIPNPHLYPGSMPPLFRAVAWDSSFEASNQLDQFRHNQQTNDRPQNSNNFNVNTQFSVENHPQNFNNLNIDNQLSSDDRLQGSNHININNQYPQQNIETNPQPTAISGEYVDVLPPGAETASGPENSQNSHSHVHFEDQQIIEHETASASLNPVVETVHNVNQQQQNNDNNNNNDENYNNNYGVLSHQATATPGNNNNFGEKIISNQQTKVSSDGKHIIHIEESPVIDLSSEDNEPKDSNPTPATEEAPIILQNPDGSYGINATWPIPDNHQASSEISSTIQVDDREHQERIRENVTSLLLDVLRNNEKEAEFGKRITTTQKPSGGLEETTMTEQSGITTVQPLLEALMESYNNFKKEVEEEEEKGKVDQKEIHQGAAFSTARQMKNSNRQNGKRNKQVQVVIPYTLQYTPSPFNHPQGIQSRKVPVASVKDRSRESTEATEEELSHILQTLDSLPKLKKQAKPFTSSKTNTSIDPLRLQKNIDNWTIQEYSRGTTVIPSSSHHQLSQSKKIPDEYFTTTEPVSTASDILAGFNYNDLDHEGSASSRVEIPHIQIVSSEKSENSLEIEQTTSSAEDLSWEQLPVSISPVSKERVYIVTPQPSRGSKTTSTGKDTARDNSTTQFDSIERAYQVLPQAVNNLAVASTGPATLPLWGIMEHEEYASTNATSTSPIPAILYSGHSRVSHTRQRRQP